MTPELSAPDIGAIERATVATVSPEATETVEDWLLAFDRGAIGRAKCAVPLSHSTPDLAVIAAIEQRYATRGFRPMFRLPDADTFAAFRAALGQAGYRPDRHSLVQVAACADVRRLVTQPQVDFASQPDAAWGNAFLGEGFDPVDGASRVRALSRAPDAAYASVRDVMSAASEPPDAIAVGAASFAFGWASFHGMRTVLAHRGKGLAGRVLAALAQEAIDRGYDRVFLQVEEHNAAARSLYERAGFATAWRYAYWQR